MWYIAQEVSNWGNIGESYDKEWALREQSIRDGIDKGREEKSRDIAFAMIKENIDIEIISKCTGLSIDEINKL